MPIDLTTLSSDMRVWRQHLHAFPEFGFTEHASAGFIVARLREMGIQDIATGIGGTGVVATLSRGTRNLAVALRADMDALRIQERGDHPHRSTNPGLMHACGHDGHTAMLLGAARLLIGDTTWDGTIRLIFQPAEEWGGGALAMLADGLLERFPFDEIYGVHNWPGLPVGRFETCVGPIMAAEDIFEIIVTGVGCHAARPHQGHDPLVAACTMVTALQTIVSRRLDPAETAVVSVTEIKTDGARNVLPGTVRVSGDARSFTPEASRTIEQEMRRIASGVAEAHGCRAEVEYCREFAPLINEPGATSLALSAARGVFGIENVVEGRLPVTASEDFARFIERVPGCYAFVGNGVSSLPLHNDRYDFNDDALISGATYLAAVAKQSLSQAI